MSRPANPLRGEADLTVGGECFVLRPTFEALVAAEQDLGSLFALVERASEGMLTLAEIAGLLWHCLPQDKRPAREVVGEAVVAMGILAATGPVRVILAQVLQGQR